MALIVETGAVVADAESYATLVYADAYHLARGNTAWADVTVNADREVWLRKATAQMESRYRTMWKGKKSVGTQSLSWPRINVKDEDGYEVAVNTVPNLVKAAQCEVALLLLAGNALVQGVVTSDDASVSSESVGPISISYSKGNQQVSYYPFVDEMLAPLATITAMKANITLGLTADELDGMAGTGRFDPANYPDYFNVIP